MNTRHVYAAILATMLASSALVAAQENMPTNPGAGQPPAYSGRPAWTPYAASPFIEPGPRYMTPRRNQRGYGYPGYRGHGGSPYPGHRQYGNPPGMPTAPVAGDR